MTGATVGGRSSRAGRFGYALALLMCAAIAAASAPCFAATMGPQPAAASAGSVARVPIYFDLGTEVADRLGFSLQVSPVGGSPALTTNLDLQAAVGGGTVLTRTTTNLAVSWFSPISPPLTGSVLLGEVLVALPASAQPGDGYTVQMLSVGATYNDPIEGLVELTVAPGPDVLALVLGSGSGQIAITVTLGTLGVEVAPNTWELGVLAPGEASSTSQGHFTATNTGSVTQDFTLSAGRTTPSDWGPGTAAGIDTYALEVSSSGSPGWTIVLTEAPLADGVTASASVSFDLRFTAPIAGSAAHPDGEIFAISIGATAAP